MTLAITLLATCTLCNIFVLCTNNLCKSLQKDFPQFLKSEHFHNAPLSPTPPRGLSRETDCIFVSFRLALHRAILVQKWLECGVIRNYIRTKRNMGQVRFNIPSARIFTDSGKNIQRCFSLAQRRTPNCSFRHQRYHPGGFLWKMIFALMHMGDISRGGWADEVMKLESALGGLTTPLVVLPVLTT